MGGGGGGSNSDICFQVQANLITLVSYYRIVNFFSPDGDDPSLQETRWLQVDFAGRFIVRGIETEGGTDGNEAIPQDDSKTIDNYVIHYQYEIDADNDTWREYTNPSGDIIVSKCIEPRDYIE